MSCSDWMPELRSAGEFAGLRIPSLEAVLDLADDRHVPVCIDVKGATPSDAAATAVAVAELIRSRAGSGPDAHQLFPLRGVPGSASDPARDRCRPGRHRPRCQQTRSQPSSWREHSERRITMHRRRHARSDGFSTPRGRCRSLGLGRHGRGKHRPERLARCRRHPGQGCCRRGEGARPSLSARRSDPGSDVNTERGARPTRADLR